MNRVTFFSVVVSSFLFGQVGRAASHLVQDPGEAPKNPPAHEFESRAERDLNRKIKSLILSAKEFEKGEGLSALTARQEAAKLVGEIAELGHKMPEPVLKKLVPHLFDSSEFVRIYVLEVLIAMDKDSKSAASAVKELSSVEIEPGPAFRAVRWLNDHAKKEIEIPLELKFTALKFSCKKPDAFLLTSRKLREIAEIGKKHRKQVESLANQMADDDDQAVARTGHQLLNALDEK